MIERKGREVEENPGIGKNEGGNEASQDIVVHASLNDRWLFYTTALTMKTEPGGKMLQPGYGALNKLEISGQYSRVGLCHSE